jgi:hypothetical protein
MFGNTLASWRCGLIRLCSIVVILLYGIRCSAQPFRLHRIVEGSERGSKEFAHYLRIACGSAAELRTQAYIAAKVGLIDAQSSHEIVDETKQIAKMLFALSKSLEK